MTTGTTAVFPPLTRADVLRFQFSQWYPGFKKLTFKSTVIRPLSEGFKSYLQSDGVHIPKGSDNVHGEDGSPPENEEEEEDVEDAGAQFSFPELDAQIRQVIADYGAVFPKLNFTSPKDASWLLPSSSPLKCTSPMDVYVLLKSSDFVTHDISPENVFEGCQPGVEQYDLELVLRKWYHVDPGREFRCFVRDRRFVGITQRDTNFYEHLTDKETQILILNTITQLWEKEIKYKWSTMDYSFDLVLARNLQSAHIIDFNPYAQRTDALLFTYDELSEIHDDYPETPTLKVIESKSHPAVTRNAPANAHNMVPFEMLSFSAGQTLDNFADKWRDKIQEAMEDSD